MSAFIDYSRRPRAANGSGSDEGSPEHQHSNPFGDHQQAQYSQQVNSDVEAANQHDTMYGGRQQQQAPSQSRRGHHFDIEQVHTTGDTMQQQAPAEPFFDPAFDDYNEEPPLEMVFFDHVVQNYGEMNLFNKIRLFIRQSASFGLTLGGLGLVLVMAFAAYLNPRKKSPPRARGDREYERRMTGERFSGRPQYYANYWGYRCDEHEIVTEGGWILKAHRVSDPRRNAATGYPVILQHGILCNSSHFFVCEERSMAFWMVDQGYDVWVTNVRANFGAGHTEYTRNDPRFWAFGLKELAFDLRDVIEFITGATGRPRVAYVGHSQGSGSMYIALSPGVCPELGHKISSFTALGPSVYSGPVLRSFPFSIMRQFRSRKWWSTIFGVKEFIPAIGLFHQYLPAYIFGHLGYVIFSYLFGFHDHNWVVRQKPKIFRSLPVPTSSELLYYYMSGFSHRGCIFDPRIQEPWFPRSFPRHSIYYGNLDMLVLGKPLAQRMERHERNVDIVHAVELEGYEHLDFIMGMDAHRVVFTGIKDTIESSISAEERSPDMAEIH